MSESPVPSVLRRLSSRNALTPRLAAFLVALSLLLLALPEIGTADDDDDDDDPHQEWITFVQQKGGKRLYG